MNIQLENAVSYLNKKGVRFMVQKNYETGEEKIVGLSIKKYGKFWKANGKIISGNFAKFLLSHD